MHPNPTFRQTPPRQTLDLIRSRGFGTLAVNAPDGPLLSHVPFLLSDDATSADLHLLRSNPILKQPDAPAVIAVAGPDAYISPDWYEAPDQVPTWNYVAAHLRGRLTRLPDSDMPEMLARQSAAFEARLAPKPPWTMDKMTPEVRDRMMRMIVPCRLLIDDIDATWKLGQNKPPEVRRRAALQVEKAGIGAETLILSQLMDDPPSPET